MSMSNTLTDVVHNAGAIGAVVSCILTSTTGIKCAEGWKIFISTLARNFKMICRKIEKKVTRIHIEVQQELNMRPASVCQTLTEDGVKMQAISTGRRRSSSSMPTKRNSQYVTRFCRCDSSLAAISR